MNNAQPSPGIYYGVEPNVYHTWEACSNSWLAKLRQSPAHLRDLLDNGPQESTAAQQLGQAVHTIVLEPDEYLSRFAVRDEGVSGVTKAGKDFKAKWQAAGMTVLTYEDGRWCEAIARRATANRRMAEWINRAHETEVSLVWERDGYLCRARADLMVPGLNILADLKTTMVASQEGFAREIGRYHYHTQAAWYLDGIRRLTGQEWDFYFVACEKRRPFLVSCHQLVRSSPAHLLGLNECDILFERYKACMKSGQWPGYGDVFEINLPESSFASEYADEPLD